VALRLRDISSVFHTHHNGDKTGSRNFSMFHLERIKPLKGDFCAAETDSRNCHTRLGRCEKELEKKLTKSHKFEE